MPVPFGPLLRDKVRCEAYQRAIHQGIKKGDKVVDIGTGTGLLSYFAIQAGAEKVYAIEQHENTIELAKRFAKANRVGDRIVFIKGLSTEVNLPEKVDVIMSEILGHFALDEDILKYTIDARERFLKRGGILIPSYLEMFIAPVEVPYVYKKRNRILE